MSKLLQTSRRMSYRWTFLHDLVRYIHDKKRKYHSRKTPAKTYDDIYWNKEIVIKRF